jgi:hypothetical protein
MGNIIYIIIVFVVIMGYYIYKNIKKKIMIKKDYNRKINNDDLKVRKDLQILRNQLFQSDNPEVNNQIIKKIQTIVNMRDNIKEV